MMFESGMDESVTKVAIDVTLEIYLKGWTSSIQPILTFVFNRDHLTEGDELDSFMSIITHTLREVWDRKSEPWFVFSDSRYNKYIFPKEEVQGICILSPEDSLKKVLELEEE